MVNFRIPAYCLPFLLLLLLTKKSRPNWGESLDSRGSTQIDPKNGPSLQTCNGVNRFPYSGSPLGIMLTGGFPQVYLEGTFSRGSLSLKG
jgi:hypothetical protein